MRKRTKLLVRLLTAVLCVSLLPITVLAEPDEGDPGTGMLLNAWPAESEDPETDSITYDVPLGKTKDLVVAVEADESCNLTYSWTRSRLLINAWDEAEISEATGNTCTTDAIDTWTQYVCCVTDTVSGQSEFVYFYLQVINNLQAYVRGHEQDNGYFEDLVEPGSSKSYTLGAYGDELEGLTYKWIIDNEIVGTDDTYEVTNITAPLRLEGQVIDQYSNTVNVIIDVVLDTGFDAWPAGCQGTDMINMTVAYNEPVDLSVCTNLADSSSLSYQWYKSSREEQYLNEIDGEIKASLTTGPIKEYAEYACSVRDAKSGQSKMVYFYLNIDNEFNAFAKGTDEDWTFLKVARDDAATIEVEATGIDTNGITYKWYCDEELIEGENESTLTTQGITEPVTYRCELFDRFGNAAAVHFVINIENEVIAWVTGEDEDCVEKEVLSTQGATETLSVSVRADNESGITYQWSKFDSEGGYVDIEGATDSTYEASVGSEVSTYCCTIHDSLSGKDLYIYFSVFIDNNLKARIAGTDTTEKTICVREGESTELSVVVTANEMDGLRYEWYCGDTELDNNSSSLTSDPVYDYTYYQCNVYDKYGNCVSVSFSLEPVDEIPGWAAGREDWGNYQYCTVLPGGFLTLAVDTDWDSGITFTWYIEKIQSNIPYEALWGDKEVISGETGDSIVVGPINEKCRVSCEMTDEQGFTGTVSFVIYVENDIEAFVTETGNGYDGYREITYNLENLGEDKLMSVSCRANDPSGMQYAWFKYIPDGTSEKIPGANGNEYTARNICKEETYYCVVTDKYMNYRVVEFNFAIDSDFDVWASDSGTSKMDNWYFFSNKEGYQTLSVSTNADDVTYAWYYSEDWNDRTLCENSNTPEFTVKTGENEVVPARYWCLAIDSLGHYEWIMFDAYVDVVVWAKDAESAGSIWERKIVERGGSANLEVLVDSLSDEEFVYEWHMIDENGDNTLLNETSCCLTLNNILGSASYHCILSRRNGEELETVETVCFDVVCVGAWVKDSEDHEREKTLVVDFGDSVSVEVTADASISNPEYQWYSYEKIGDDEYGNVLIEGANSAVYTIDNAVKKTDLYCEVTDENGNHYWVEYLIYVDGAEVQPAHIIASSLTLDGYLKVNFKFELPDVLVNDVGAYIMINNTKFLISDAEVKSGYYYFTYSVASSEIQKAIVLKVYSSDGELFALTSQSGIDYTTGFCYSIMQYLKAVEKMSDEKLATYTNKPDELRELVARLGDYGTLAQAYFKDNRSSGYISDSELEQVDAVKSSDPDLERCKATITKAQNCGIKYSGNLSLETATHLNHYFTLEEGRSIDEYEIRVNEDLITTESTGAITLKLVSGNKYCLKIDDIAAPDLDEGYNISVVEKQSGETLISVEGFSALSYIYLYLRSYENDTSKANIVRTLKSLYLYNQAANGFFG